MAHAQLVDVITGGFMTPTLPKQPGKPSYRSIQDTHCLLTADTASTKSPCGGGHNSHLGLVLNMTQYALVSIYPFIRPTNPGRTPRIPSWTILFDKKALLYEHAKQRQQYDECHNVDTALCNQLLKSFEDTYLPPLKNAFAGYSRSTTLNLLSHLYAHYAKILATDLAENDRKLRDTYNTDEPLESL